MHAISINLGKEHWQTIKRILRYTKKMKLCVKEGDLEIYGYLDADFAKAKTVENPLMNTFFIRGYSIMVK